MLNPNVMQSTGKTTVTLQNNAFHGGGAPTADPPPPFPG